MVVWTKVGRRKKEVCFMVWMMADLEGMETSFRDICFLKARIPVLVPSEGSPSDMSLWPSDMIADQASAPQSIGVRKRKDRTGQEGQNRTGWKERRRKEVGHIQETAKHDLSPTLLTIPDVNLSATDQS